MGILTDIDKKNIAEDETFSIAHRTGTQKRVDFTFKYRDVKGQPPINLTDYSVKAIIEEVDNPVGQELESGFNALDGGEIWELNSTNEYAKVFDAVNGVVRVIIPEDLGKLTSENGARMNDPIDSAEPALPKKYLFGVFLERGAGVDKVSLELRGIINLEYSIVNG